MLTVKTYIAPSTIAGMGCFAEELIKKGTILWTLDRSFDLVLTQEVYNKLPLVTQSYLKNFAYFNENEGGYVLCSDHAKYFNHSDNPNCIAEGLNTIAIRDILVGEEITENYYNFDQLAKSKLS